jgi:hypothetical protein
MELHITLRLLKFVISCSKTLSYCSSDQGESDGCGMGMNEEQGI